MISKNYRLKGYEKILLTAMENYLRENGCKDIFLGVFGYNENAIKFYKQNGYNARMIEMTKKF